jgi:uncharacterized DUF497 family protein
MQFEWDRAKAEVNLRKHGVSFDDALHVFADPFRLDEPDFRADYGEARRLTMGEVDGRLHVVAYTMRGEVVRLISARKANEREQRRYRAAQR